ncbi:DUF6249 domain-containing protein [Candidatus Latescibacterota bacterium]
MGELIGLTAVVLIFGSVPAVIIFIIAKRHKEKMMMINKGPIHSQTFQGDCGSAPLLWGIVAMAIGLASLFSGYVVQQRIDRDLVTFGTFLLFGGCASLIYWKITKKERDTARNLNEEYMKKMIENLKTPGSEE